MTTCDRLSDRMPAVQAGRAGWSAGDLAHLAECRDCGDEWRLVQRGARLGAGLAEIDHRRVAEAVRNRRLADERGAPVAKVVAIESRQRPWLGRWVAALAAAAVITFAVVRERGPRRPDPELPIAAGAILSELDELTAPELETVLGDLENGSVEDQVGGLGDLDSGELEQILQSWES